MSAPNRPRVAMALNSFGLGGVPEVAFQLMRHLPRERFDLALLVLNGGFRDDEARAERQSRFRELGVSVHVATQSERKINMIAAAADWLATEKIELLHTHSYRPNIYARLAGAILRPVGLRMIAHYHNRYDDKWDEEPESLSFERHLAATTDGMIAVSCSVGRSVCDRLGLSADAIDVVENGVDPSIYAPVDRARARRSLGILDDRPVVGLIGRICEQKAQDIFVDAAIVLARDRRDALFLMFGHAEDEDLKARLEQRIAVAGRSDAIRFMGHASDMAAVYAALDVVAAPSRWEGHPLMLIEALSAGKPVVAAAIDAIVDVARDRQDALLAPPNNSGALASAISELLGDADLRARLGAAGAARRAEFCWSKAADRIAEIYDRVLCGARS